MSLGHIFSLETPDPHSHPTLNPFVKDFNHPTLRGYANYDFDDNLDVFDFLEFINAFVKGCP